MIVNVFWTVLAKNSYDSHNVRAYPSDLESGRTNDRTEEAFLIEMQKNFIASNLHTADCDTLKRTFMFRLNGSGPREITLASQDAFCMIAMTTINARNNRIPIKTFRMYILHEFKRKHFGVQRLTTSFLCSTNKLEVDFALLFWKEKKKKKRKLEY